MNNVEMIDLGELHERMVERTRAFMGDGVTVAAYARYRDKIPSPLILFSLESSPMARPGEMGTGQLMTDLEFSAFVAVDGMDEGAAVTVRMLAMRLKGWLFRNNFGMELEWPEVGDAREAEFEWPRVLKNADEFEIWRVDFVFRNVEIGANCWEKGGIWKA